MIRPFIMSCVLTASLSSTAQANEYGVALTRAFIACTEFFEQDSFAAFDDWNTYSAPIQACSDCTKTAEYVESETGLIVSVMRQTRGGFTARCEASYGTQIGTAAAWQVIDAWVSDGLQSGRYEHIPASKRIFGNEEYRLCGAVETMPHATFKRDDGRLQFWVKSIHGISQIIGSCRSEDT